MKIANIYNHLNGMEYIQVHKRQLWQEITNAIFSIDASQFTKISKDASKNGKVVYSQKELNKELNRILGGQGWSELRTQYFVTGNLQAEKMISKLNDADLQKQIIS